MRVTVPFRSAERTPLLQVVKSAVATIIAWLLADWLFDGPPPVFAAIAALLVVQPSVNQSLTRAIERSIGVIAGVAVATGLGIVLGDANWVILLAMLVAFVFAWLLKMTPGTANQVAISAILVLALGGGSADYAIERIVETLIGAVIGIIVNLLIVPPVAVGPATDAVRALGDELARSLQRLAHALETPRTPAQLHELLVEVRLLTPMREKAEQALDDAAESLTLNPRRTRHRADLAAARDRLDTFRPIVTQTIGMTRAFADRYDEQLPNEPVVRAIAEQLHRAAHDVRLAGAEPAGQPDARDAVPALTAPLVVKTPSSDHWVLFGSLLEDLRRIHESLGEVEGPAATGRPR